MDELMKDGIQSKHSCSIKNVDIWISPFYLKNKILNVVFRNKQQQQKSKTFLSTSFSFSTL